jgi:hypothetical protein
MISARSSVDPAGTPCARRSVSAIVAVASAIVLLAAGTACGSSSSSNLGAPNPSVPEATPAGSSNLAAPAPTGPEGTPPSQPEATLTSNNLAAPALTEPAASAAVSSIQPAQQIELLVEGKEQLGPLEGSDGQAISANCDPSTVSNPDTSTMTASCEITYADGSVWQQTVTVTFDSQGNPVAALASVGTEVSPPTGGSSSGGSP